MVWNLWSGERSWFKSQICFDGDNVDHHQDNDELLKDNSVSVEEIEKKKKQSASTAKPAESTAKPTVTADMPFSTTDSPSDTPAASTDDSTFFRPHAKPLFDNEEYPHDPTMPALKRFLMMILVGDIQCDIHLDAVSCNTYKAKNYLYNSR